MTEQGPRPNEAREVPASIEHGWLSNPLDWPHIDRMILLAVLVLVSPVAFGTGLLVSFLAAPQWFDPRCVMALLGLYTLGILLLTGFIAAAFRVRRERTAWPLMENVVIGAYLLVTFVESWLSGTHFTLGLLLLFLGMNITSSLASIDKLRKAYLVICVVIVAMAIAEFSRLFPYAPLFARPPYNADGSPVWMWAFTQVTLALVLLGILYIGLVATERWWNRENLYREMSTIDGLTRLTNRRSFIERGESEFVRAQRNGSLRLCCIMLDIDHFKSINDTYGHPAGDAVLVKVSGILLDNKRQYDEVGRFGGEEFAILLPNSTLENGVQVAERLREKIAAAEIVVDGKVIQVTSSFGVAAVPGQDIGSLQALLKAADVALYEAKHAGRNRVVAAGAA